MTEPGSTDSIGERLRNLRQSRGLSQEQLARLLGVSFVTVNRWESGRTNISAKAAASLAELKAALAAGAKKLLLLDGAERIADQVAELAGELLDAVPELRIVVTSRVVLGVPGEVCWTVPPLACPSLAAGAADIAGSDAVQLFIARASERLPDFRAADVAPHAIAELCRRLDGLPLAIELIAGWVGTLSIKEILQQRAVLLDSEPATRAGRRLADVLQVSYDLLTAQQQRRPAGHVGGDQ